MCVRSRSRALVQKRFFLAIFCQVFVVYVCVCVRALARARARVCKRFFLRFCVKYLLYINAYIAVPAKSLQDFAQVRSTNVCLSLADAPSTCPARTVFRPLSFYRFC